MVKFSKWFLWKNRANIPHCDLPGVYILAKFRKSPKGNADPLNKNIIYVGETCNNSLQGRWYQFHRSAFESKNGHSGGWTYQDIEHDSGKNLFVAAFPVSKTKANYHLLIRYVERKLIYDYARKYGQQPRINKK